MSNIRVIKRVADQINARVSRVKNKRTMQRLATQAKNQIVIRTRLGKGVRLNGSTFNFPPLSDAYKKQRNRYKKRLSSKTTPNTSNVHATGQLVEKSIKIIATNNRFTLYLNKSRGRDLFGRQSKIDNVELNRILSRRRRWFDFSTAERRFLSRQIRVLLLR
jgi:hypothetical protein